VLFHDYSLSKNIQQGLWVMKKNKREEKNKHMLRSMKEKKREIERKNKET
jgi:hypothetical protein